MQLDRLRRAGRYAPRQEPTAQAERPQWLSEKERAGPVCYRTGTRALGKAAGAFFRVGATNPLPNSLRSAYGASWAVQRPGTCAESVLNLEKGQ